MVDKAKVTELNSERQVGDDFESGTGRENSHGLRFDCHEDALDYIRKIRDDSQNWATLENFDIAKSYEECKICIILQFILISGCGKCQLVFSCIPSKGYERGAGPQNASYIDSDAVDLRAESDQLPMLIHFSQAIKAPQGVIPSLVRFERTNNGHDFRRELSERGPHIFLEKTLVFTDEKRNAIEADSGIFRPGAGAESLIQGVPQVVKGIGSDRKQEPGDLAQEPSFADIVAGIRDELNDIGIWVFVEERLASTVKFLSVFASPIEQKIGASEKMAGHDRESGR
jgi:hypothetical protein